MPTATVRAETRPATAPPALIDRIAVAATRPVSSGSCAVHRVLLGLFCAFSAARFVSKGWVEDLYLAPEHHLTFAWFPWVRPLPPVLMYAVVLAMVPLGLAIAAGYHTRAAALGYLVLFAYCELIDAATYLNHYWYLTLALTLVVALPLSGRATVPSAVVWVLRGQVAVVYLMAGLAKLNHDWLVRGEPMATWLASRTDAAVIGPLLDEPWAGVAASWVGAASPPHWPRRFWAGSSPPVVEDPAQIGRGRWVVVGLVLWAALQLAIPLRHLAYPGDVRWTEEGYYGSFRVMLTEKTGWLQFEVTDPATGETWSVRPSAVLTDWQERQAVSRADLTLAAARLVAGEMARHGHPGVEVRAESFVSFNGRRRQRMIDPTVDLAALSPRSPASAYVLPLEPPTMD